MNRIVCRPAALIALVVATPLALAQTPVGTAFTYQGQLKENGVPVNTTGGTFEFKLFDADAGGNQIGNTVSLMQVNVNNGLFTVGLDFGAEAFGGEARWLEIRVYKTGTGWVTLSPRQPVRPTPYATTAANLTLPFTASVPDGVGDAFAIDYAGSGYAISAISTGADGVAIYGSGSAYDTPAVMGQAAGPMATGVQGYASATGPDAANFGGWFGAQGQEGMGVYAAAMAASGANYGVYGRSESSEGTGVYGYAPATTGVTHGVTGVAGSPWGTGVYGYANASGGQPVGVYGRADAPTGWAGHFVGRGYFSGDVGIGTTSPTAKLDVAGITKTTGFQLATAPTPGYVLTCDATGIGTWQPAGAGSSLWQLTGQDIYYDAGNVGIGTAAPGYRLHVSAAYDEIPVAYVEGSGTEAPGLRVHTSGEDSPAIDASATATSVAAIYGSAPYAGGQFYATGADGRGIWAQATATSGTTTGVYGYVSSGAGRAVYGENVATTGNAYGVYGKSISSGGRGVYGEATATSGSTYGVIGRAMSSPGGVGVEGEGGAIGVEAYTATPSGYGVYALNEADYGDAVAVRGDTTSPDGYGGYFQGRGYFSGNVGIGVTSPTQKLDVAGTVKASGIQLTNGPTAGYVLTCDASGNGTWQQATGGGESLWQQNGSDIYYDDGDVGIGTASPAYPLHVTGTATTLLRVESPVGSGTPAAVHGTVAAQNGRAVYGVNSATSGTGSGVLGQASSPTGYAVCGSNSAGWGGYFLGKGYFSSLVGIGTTSPQAPLDVNGVIRATGFRMTTSPTDGYVLTCDANGVGTWQEPTGGLTLPYDGTYSGSAEAFSVTNTGAGYGIYGESTSRGVYGNSATGHGVYGGSSTGVGVKGNCPSSGTGVEGHSSTGIGVKADNSGVGIDHPAIYSENTDPSGISIFTTCSSTDANLVVVNKGTGDIVKGFSGPTGGNLVFRVQNDGTTSVSVLNITGGADLSEQFDVNAVGTEPQPGQVVCIDPENPGRLVVSAKAYDRTVAGVISGAGGVQPGMTMGQHATVADGEHPVALTGRVYVWADASQGAIEPGDLLTTSDVSGHAMKVTDYDRSRGATLGKAMTRLSEGRGLVLVLVQPQ